MPLQPATVRKIIKELTKLQNEPPEDIRVRVDEEDVLQFEGIIAGPEGTPYRGGYFRVRFAFGDEFPAAPPKCRFITRIFHPNVSPSGEICVNTLKKDWSPSYGITHILTVIKCLLIYPNPDSALDEEAGRLVREDWDGYLKRAKLMTQVHATRGGVPEEFEAAKEQEDTLASSLLDPSSVPDPLFSTFADPAPSSSRTKVTKSKSRQTSVQPQDTDVALPESSLSGEVTGVAVTGLSITSLPGLVVPPLRTSAQSNGAPPRASPAPEKDEKDPTSSVVDKVAPAKKEVPSKVKDTSKVAGASKTLKRPASAVSGGSGRENGGVEKRKKGLKRL